MGKARPEFLSKLLAVLPETVRFAGMLFDDANEILDNEILDAEPSEEINSKSPGEELPISNPSIEGIDDGKLSDNAKKLSAEQYLSTFMKDSLETLDSSKPIEEQIESFLENIGFPRKENIVIQSFVIACNIEKVRYESIVTSLHIAFPTIKEKIIKMKLQDAFKNWLDNNPKVKEEYPRISFAALLKVVAKKMQ